MHLFSTRIHGKDNKLVDVKVSKDGKKSINGIPKQLRTSANYPVQFGLAVASLIRPYGDPDPSPESERHLCDISIPHMSLDVFPC